MLGFGAHSHLHASKILSLSEDLPIVVEIVDSSENLERLYAFLANTVKEALVITETVHAVRYRS